MQTPCHDIAADGRGALRILVVEDHADTRQLIALYLQMQGHSVETATTMHEALEALSARECDLLLSDIGLPDGDGWELLRQAKPNSPPYAIAMSGFGMVADQARSREAGFRHHMVKPISADKLDAMLEKVAAELRSE